MIYIILYNFGGRIRGDFEVVKGGTPSPPSPCCKLVICFSKNLVSLNFVYFFFRGNFRN